EAKVTPALDVVQNINVAVKKDINVEVLTDENAAYGPYQYEWNTPSGSTIEKKNFNIQRPSAYEFGVYQLVVTDNRGCKQFKSVDIKSDAAVATQTWADGNISQNEVVTNRNQQHEM